MDKNKHTEFDFQVFTQQMMIEQMALIRTVIQSQMMIMKALTKESSHKQINELIRENRDAAEDLANKMPFHSEMNVPLKDFH